MIFQYFVLTNMSLNHDKTQDKTKWKKNIFNYNSINEHKYIKNYKLNKNEKKL
jgi:hypothetical protein